MNTAELKGEWLRDFTSKQLQSMVDEWYDTKQFYEFPGETEPFESCNKTTSANKYDAFTQVSNFA